MISVLLNLYSNEECKTLHEIISAEYHALPCKLEAYGSLACEVCPHRHLCYDLRHISLYLQDEINDGFPHCHDAQLEHKRK